MTREVKNKIKHFLLNGQINECLQFLELVQLDEKTRTKKQNDSFHLWLEMIEKSAENQGVTQDMLIKHTTQLRVTSEWLKSAVKQLINVLWGYTSTTQLKKQGDLDIVIDHVTDWLGKEMEVPSFPSEKDKPTTLKNIETARRMDYPEDIYNGEKSPLD